MDRPKLNVLAILAFVIAVIALFLPRGPQVSPSPTLQSALERVKETKTLRIGFEGYPPYTVRDPRNNSISGYSVDIAEAIAKEANWQLQWVETSANTKIADLKEGKFDVMVEPIFQTISRAAEVSFTRPYAYFGYAAAIVRKGETRFAAPSDLNNPGVKVVVRQGYTDESWAQDNLPSASIRAMAVGDIGLVFQEVLSGNADIALADAAQVAAYAQEHSGRVEARFLNPPPASVPAGFMLREGDFAFANFLDSAISYLEANGLFDRLDQKYGVTTAKPGTHAR